MADSGVMSDALQHRSDVHAYILCESGDLVGKRESHREEDVGCVLDEAGFFGAHDQQRRLRDGERVLYTSECVRVSLLAEGPDDYASGSADVFQGASCLLYTSPSPRD